jgi:hypothetical protein
MVIAIGLTAATTTDAATATGSETAIATVT